MWLSVWLRGDWLKRSRKRPCKCAALRSVGQEPVQSRHIVCLALQRQWLQSTKHGTRNTEHGTRNTEHGTRNKNGRLFGKHLQYGRCRFCRASLGAMQQMSMCFVASIVLCPLARTGSPGCGVPCDSGHLLHFRIHAKTLNRLQGAHLLPARVFLCPLEFTRWCLQEGPSSCS